MQKTKTKCRCTTFELCQRFILSQEDMLDIRDRLLKSMLKGLSKEGHEAAAVRCYQTFVQDFPTGNETGIYMALDLGGTNFRVLSIVLEGEGKPLEMIKESYEFPHEKKKGTGEALFDHVADCVHDFFRKHAVRRVKNNEDVPLGFTFSFPLAQDNLHTGYLIKWTKGFQASGVVGENVVKLLQNALEKKHFGVRLWPIIICNDTTGTLMSTAVIDRNVKIGLIVGTGNNTCYVERTENIENFKGDPSKPYMVINTEWGNFGADGVIDDYLTQYDKTLIEASSHGRNQTFEKCVGGRYLGEIMRLVLIKLIQEKILFTNSTSIGQLDKPYGFRSEFITKIETDPEGGPFQWTKEVLLELAIEGYDEQDLVDVHFVAQAVSTRAACFIGSGIATIINKMGFSPVTVAVDGTLYRRHPRIKTIMEKVTKCLVKPGIEFKYMLSEDGSGRGAALVAAVTATK